MSNYLNLPTAETQNVIADALMKMANTHKPTDYSGSPGNNFLIAGDRENGFYGFVQPEDFGKIASNPAESTDFNGTNLALKIGLAAGTPINMNTAWMKFSRNGRVLFVPVKPLRHTVSWDHIYKAGAVYGDDTTGVLAPKGRMGVRLAVDAVTNSFTLNPETVGQGFLVPSGVIAAIGDTVVGKGFANADNNKEFVVESITDTSITVTGGVLISEQGTAKSAIYNKTSTVKQDSKVTLGGRQYRVRLLKGAAQDALSSYANADRGSVGPNNEWNSLILPLHEKAKLGNWAYRAYAGTVPDWGVGLSDRDLSTHNALGLGSYSWCQETSDTLSHARVVRGHTGASIFAHSTFWYAFSNYGWRPCLELI